MTLTGIKNKLVQEKQEKTMAYQKSVEDFGYYENIRVSLIGQKEITSQYST